MPVWTGFGLLKGKATTGWPATGKDDGQQSVFGMPRFTPEKCAAGCRECADICPTGAITVDPRKSPPDQLSVDYGRCIVCQLCVEACPEGAAETSHDWAYAVRQRSDLVNSSPSTTDQAEIPAASRAGFRRSLHIRHVDAGSCNGCESELQALNNPFYNLHRLGIFFTPSPRFADLLLVTGPVTYAMHAPLLAAYEAMPQPRWVMAMGTCAVSGGMAGGGYACSNGLDGILPVDLYLPGCPPNPAAMIQGFLMFLDRAKQQTKHGHNVR